MSYRKSTTQYMAVLQRLEPFCKSIDYGNPKELCDILHVMYVVDDFSYHDDWHFWTVMEYFEKTVVPHKIAVFKAGIEIWEKVQPDGIVKDEFVENLYLHDLSKFSANESFGYAHHNFKSDKPDYSFELAWQHHKCHNAHHPQYWLSVNQSGKVTPLDMKDIYVLEMVADWMGASEVYGTPMKEWIDKNLSKFMWTEKTDQRVDAILTKLSV